MYVMLCGQYFVCKNLFSKVRISCSFLKNANSMQCWLLWKVINEKLMNVRSWVLQCYCSVTSCFSLERRKLVNQLFLLFFFSTESYVNFKNYMVLDTVNFVFCWLSICLNCSDPWPKELIASSPIHGCTWCAHTIKTDHAFLTNGCRLGKWASLESVLQR